MSQLDTVVSRIRAAGGSIEAAEGKTYLFSGLDGTTDEGMIAEAKPRAAVASQKGEPQFESSLSWLVDELLSYNLSLSTPIDAMNYVANLQKRLREELQKQDTPRESPAGHGLQE